MMKLIKHPAASRQLLLSTRPLLLLCLPAAVWVLALLAAGAAAEDAPPPAHRPGCRSRCGGVDIPYPFGIVGGDPQCAMHSGFKVNCTRVNGTDDKPYMGPFEVASISVPDAKARFKMPISWQCYDQQAAGQMKRFQGSGNFKDTPFRFSYEDNKIYVIGCNTLAYITTEYYSIGCLSQCYGNPTNVSSCSPGAGHGCCEANVPHNMENSRSYFNPDYNDTSACGYTVVMEAKAFSYSTTYRNSSSFWYYEHNGTVPVVMDWRITYDTCEEAKKNLSTSLAPYACVDANSRCVNATNGPGYRCKCRDGYQGNPYVEDGCTDIDECRQVNTNNCTAIGAAACENTQGSYTCLCPRGKTMEDGRCTPEQKSSPWLIPVVGASGGLVALIVTVTCACLIQQRRKLHQIKDRYFHEHGGTLLLEELRSQHGATTGFKIFTEAQLQEATDNFSEARVLGQGGHGTVYSGLLKQGNNAAVQVAVKKCNNTSVDEHHRKEFGKEMLILSQINHRNIVKLLGCCLEVQVPMLVYEFVPNGTLFQLIHGSSNKQTRPRISLATRVQIAQQSAEALAYLHSSASPPILHGDVKSSNILLDHGYTAKVSDFGASILAPTDESQFVTFVQGTRGYLDPEYMQICKLTDKSDVYSFGVVLLELLTRQKPFNFDAGPEDEKSLVLRFLSAVAKEGQLEEILDDEIKSQEKMDMEVLAELADLAMQCLEMSGANRPSMRHVSERLDSLRKVVQHPWAQQQQQQQHNPEEMESLLGESASSLASPEVAEANSTGNYYFSIEERASRSLLRSGR